MGIFFRKRKARRKSSVRHSYTGEEFMATVKAMTDDFCKDIAKTERRQRLTAKGIGTYEVKRSEAAPVPLLIPATPCYNRR